VSQERPKAPVAAAELVAAAGPVASAIFSHSDMPWMHRLEDATGV
jgi:hypothetical protein